MPDVVNAGTVAEVELMEMDDGSRFDMIF